MSRTVRKEPTKSVGMLVAYAATACIILMAGAAAYLNSLYQESAAQKVLATQRVVDLLNQLENAITDAETGERGYLLTGRQDFLEPYRAANGEQQRLQAFKRPPIHDLLSDVRTSINGDVEAQDEIQRIEILVNTKLGELRKAIELHDARRIDAALALVREGQGKRIMDDLRSSLNNMRAHMGAKLITLEHERQHAYRQAYLSAGGISVLSLVTLAVLILTTRHSSKRLALAQTRLTKLADADLIGIIFATTDGAIQYANNEFLRIVGYTREECERGEVRWDSITPVEWQNVDRQHIEEARLVGFTERYEKEYVRRDGTRIPVMVGFAFIDDSHANVIAFIVDLTKQKQQEAILRQQEEQLQKESQRKDEFIAVLAHELRNPLAPIQASVDLMKLMPSPSTAFDRTRDVIDRQLAHLVRLIDDLLDISRITAGKLELKLEHVNVVDIVNSAIEVSDAFIVAGGHTLDIKLLDAPLFIDADPVRMSQVLTNLLNNAAKYTPHGGHICLTVRRHGDMACFEVKDTGIGIEADMQSRVFDMFAQSVQGRSFRKGGIGIGLSLTKSLVQLHGGEIVLKSATGAGSNFVVRVPLSHKGKIGSAPEQLPADVRTGGVQRILIVDDNVDAARTLGQLLQASGREVSFAYNGTEAIALAMSWHPQLVFLDIGLPDMTGYEVARVLRSKPELNETKLVALTGWGAQQDRRKSAENGIDVHLTKPARVETIRESLPGLV